VNQSQHDIVIRLRAQAGLAEEYGYRDHARSLREAADEIERLRKAVTK